MGYAEFLVQKLSEKEVHQLTAYGCLVSLMSFGAHITCKVLLRQLSTIAASF